MGLVGWIHFRNTNVEIQITGSINIIDETIGTLKLHKGNIDEIEKRTNILCLSDGFNGTSEATQKDFHKIVDNFNKQLLKKKAYTFTKRR